MGCGGSKDLLPGAEKPLDHWMEPLELASIDGNFQRASGVISQIEEKRRLIVDTLEKVYEQSGAIAYKNRDLGKALKCIIWKLSVDNDGKISDIGLNKETHTFEGAKNSAEGNEAGNALVAYCKSLVEVIKPEELTNILTEIQGIVTDFGTNMPTYATEIQGAMGGNPFAGLKKISNLKNNVSKCAAAASGLKDIIVKLGALAASAPQILSALNPENMLKEAANVEKAHKQDS